MRDLCVLRSPDFSKKGQAKVTCIRKIFRRIASWKHELKKSKLLPNEEKLKNIFKKSISAEVL